MIETLNGKVDMATVNGAIDGIDVGKLLRNIEQRALWRAGRLGGREDGLQRVCRHLHHRQRRRRNQDLRLVSASLRVDRLGQRQPRRTQPRLHRPPKIQAHASSERVVINLGSLEIPVRIEGPWDKPNFSVEGQEQILEAVKEIGKNIKSKEVEEALKGLFGGGDGQQKVKPRDILDKFLKKQ